MKPRERERRVYGKDNALHDRGGLGARILREVRGYGEALAVAFIVVTFLFNTVGVAGGSMQPTLDGGVGQADLVGSLLTGDRVFIPKYDTWLRRAGVLGAYERGDIVVLREPLSSFQYLAKKEGGCFEWLLLNRCRPFFIKRVVGVPGDTVAIDAGQVVVNGARVDQGFITDAGTVSVEPVQFPNVVVMDGEVVALEIGFQMVGGVARPVLPTPSRSTGYVRIDDPRIESAYGPMLDGIVVPVGVPEGVPVLAAFRVPEDRYFVMGDNRSAFGSVDSRYFGAVESMAIAGRATAVIWPPMRGGQWNWRTLSPPEAFSAVPEQSTSHHPTD